MTAELFPTTLRRGIRGAFQESFDRAPAMKNTLAMTVQSTQREEEYGWLAGVMGMQAWKGDRKEIELASKAFSVLNDDYESNMRIKENDLADNITGAYIVMAREMGIAAAEHPDELIVALINGGAATYKSYDGKYFFASDHVEGDYTNDNAISYTVVSDHTTLPTATECQQMVQQAIAQMMRMKNRAGRYFVRRPNKLAVVVPPSLQFAFLAAMKGSVTAALATDGTNYGGAGVTNIMTNLDITVLVDSGLTDSTTTTNDRKIYVMELGRAVKPFGFQLRQKIREQIDETQRVRNKGILWGVDARYAVFPAAYWLAVEVTVTT